MSHLIDADEHYVENGSVVWEFTIEDDGGVRDLAGLTPEWYLLEKRGAPDGEAVLSTADSGVTVEVVDKSNGRVDLTIEKNVTGGLGGKRYWQRLVLQNDATKQVWGGEFPIQEQ